MSTRVTQQISRWAQPYAKNRRHNHRPRPVPHLLRIILFIVHVLCKDVEFVAKSGDR